MAAKRRTVPRFPKKAPVAGFLPFAYLANPKHHVNIGNKKGDVNCWTVLSILTSGSFADIF
jgi:hypothetical protein